MLAAGVPVSSTGVAPGAGAGVVGAGVVGAGVVGAGVVDEGVVDAGAAAAEAGETPTPMPQAVNRSPAISTADTESTALKGLIVSMRGLKYGCLVGAICRRLRT